MSAFDWGHQDDVVLVHRQVTHHGNGLFTIREEFGTSDGTVTETDEFEVSTESFAKVRAMVSELSTMLDAGQP